MSWREGGINEMGNVSRAQVLWNPYQLLKDLRIYSNIDRKPLVLASSLLPILICHYLPRQIHAL